MAHYCNIAFDPEGHKISQNCAEIEAACNGLEFIAGNASLKNCKVDIFSNLNLLDKFESDKAKPTILKLYIDKFKSIADDMQNVNHLEAPTFIG